MASGRKPILSVENSLYFTIKVDNRYIHWRCQGWLPAEFFGTQKQVAELNDRSRLRFDIAGIPRKPVRKIYYTDSSRAFGAEDAFDITDCYRVLSNQISVYPLDTSGPFVRHGFRNLAQLR